MSSAHLDTELMSIGVALSRSEIDVERAAQMLSQPRIIQHVDGSNIQQLIRLALMTAQLDPGNIMVAEVGVLLGMQKPDLEIDFGLLVGSANATTCALFAMHSISLQQGNVAAALATLRHMIPLLNAAEDKKGLLEVACWMGILNTHINAFSDAVDALTAAVGLCDDPSIAEFLPDNSALDMVREDNKNVFSFPTLKYLHSNPAEIAANIRELLSIVQAEQSS